MNDKIHSPQFLDNQIKDRVDQSGLILHKSWLIHKAASILTLRSKGVAKSRQNVRISKVLNFTCVNKDFTPMEESSPK